MKTIPIASTENTAAVRSTVTSYPLTYAHQIALDDQCYIGGKSHGNAKPFEIRQVDSEWTHDCDGFHVFAGGEEIGCDDTLEDAYFRAETMLHDRSKAAFPQLTYAQRVARHSAPASHENPEQEQQAGETEAPAPAGMSPAVAFFYNEAGYSCDPLKETPVEGRLRCANELATAEARASEGGCCFEWKLDGLDSSEWSDDEPATPTWECIMREADGSISESCGGIDFGDGEPWGNPYKRVTEAQLALGWMNAEDFTEKAKGIVESALKPCLFTFETGTVFSGFTDGTTWNGWDVVWVTPEELAKVKGELQAATIEATGEDPFAGLPERDGLTCLEGFTAALVDPAPVEMTPAAYPVATASGMVQAVVSNRVDGDTLLFVVAVNGATVGEGETLEDAVKAAREKLEAKPVNQGRAWDGEQAVRYHHTKDRSNLASSPRYDLSRAMSPSDKFTHCVRDLMHYADREGMDFSAIVAKARELRRSDSDIFDV